MKLYYWHLYRTNPLSVCSGHIYFWQVEQAKLAAKASQSDAAPPPRQAMTNSDFFLPFSPHAFQTSTHHFICLHLTRWTQEARREVRDAVAA